MRLNIVIAILAGLMFLSACSDPASDKTKAVTGEAAPVASQPATGQGQKYVITPQNSQIAFVGSKVTGSHNGSFGEFSGQIDYAGTPEQSRVSINIKSDSITTDTPDLTKHLKTADFFDVAKFPKATFTSTKIEPGSSDLGTMSYQVTGNFDLHGVKKSISFPAIIKVTPENATVSAEFSINRKDFGIVYAGKADDLIRDGVVIKLSLNVPRKK